MICKNCNKEIPNNSEYCSFCGNVTQSVISAGISSDLSKGYTYLELKQWKDAEQFFRNAIIDGENKAEAYIGKMLAKYKTDSIENLAESGKKFSSDDDFKLALKYADGEYAEYLKKCALNGANKSKKRTIIVSSICAFVIVVALLSYFVLIPLNRISNYENLLADGKVQEAVKSYQSSKWFEYDQKAKDLFYKNGLKLVETKDYENAEICFEITDGYTDNEKFLNYCKAQNLLADDDLESYNYFTDLGDFLDSKEILNTNKYFLMVNKLQGEWYYPGETDEEHEEKLRMSGDYYEVDGHFYSKSLYSSYDEIVEHINKKGRGPLDWLPGKLSAKTIKINGINELKKIDGYITYDSVKIEVIDDTHIKIGEREYEKQ